MDAARYHSLVAVRETVPDVLQVIGEDKNGEVMAVQHKTYPVYGLQFHPESILTPQGRIILENFFRFMMPTDYSVRRTPHNPLQI